MPKRVISWILLLASFCGMLYGLPLTAAAAGRYSIKNPWAATGTQIIEEARKWAGTAALYRSGIEPWEESVKWRTGYASDGQVSFDCSGFVGRVLNDCGFRATSYQPSYGNTVLSQTYKRGYIGISIEELVKYGTEIDAAVANARNGDYSGLWPGDVIGWTGGTLGRHVILYAGLKDGTPWMVEMTGRGFLDRAITPEYQAHFQYGARFAASEGETPVTKCTYPAHCKLAVTKKNTQVMSLPIKREYDGQSTVLDMAYPGEPPYIATALIQNSRDELWYKVETANGKTGYLYAGDTEYLGQLVGLCALDMNVPQIHPVGASYGLSGRFTAGYSHLTEISFLIYSEEDRQGQPKTGASLTVTGNHYSLSGNAIDNKTAFGSLPEGKYVCIATGAYINYYAATPDTVGENTGDGQVYEAVFFVSSGLAECAHSYTHSTLISGDCETNGMSRYVCSGCGSSYTKCIPATGHNYLEQKIPATIYEGEKICYTCQSCGDSYTRYTGVVYKTGDIDRSGRVNTEDVVSLLLHLSIPDMFPLELAEADLDKNGNADTQDAVLLLLHISMPELFPL